ncbi:MAG: tetratricopeptide repeat protein [Nitrospira sp.]|nr:tetratricopeptide repeat protein [Nitrospira sp.]
MNNCSTLPKIVILHDPLTGEEHLSLGLAYELNGEYDSAVKEYSMVIKKSKGDYRPLFYMGNVYYKKLDFKLSEQYYIKALRQDPDQADIHNNLAWVYIDTNVTDKALAEVNSAIKIKKDANYLDTLANLYVKMGRHDDAISVLQDAINSTPASHLDLLINEYRLLGELYEKNGKTDLADDARLKSESFKVLKQNSK